MILDTTKSGQQWPRAAVVAIMMTLTLFANAFNSIALAYRKEKGAKCAVAITFDMSADSLMYIA